MLQNAGVFLASLLILAWGAGVPGIATSYVDPVAHILAQDEAVYASTSLEMAAHGEWLSPKYLGRWAFYKPPLLYWLSAICVKVAGASTFALRFPSILAGAASVALVFAALRIAVAIPAALTGAVLLLSSHLFFVLSRIGLCDALLVLFITLAMYALARDRRLESQSSRWIFGIATGAAVMTKAMAGLLPLIILLFAGVSLGSMVQVSLIAAAVAAPWHLWQLHAHPRWFWAEYFLSEHLTWGLAAPQQTTQESQIGFYAKRIALLDPLLAIAAIAALVRTRSRLLIAWIGVILASVLAWRYRNVAYMAPMYPAMAIAVAFAIPKRHARAALGVAVALLAAKILLPAQNFGLPFRAETVNPAKAALDEYAKRHRANDLVLVEPDDQFYSSDLDLAHIRYLWIDPSTGHAPLPLDFEYLGITMRAADFNRFDQVRAMYAQRLREWNLDSEAPLATVVLAGSAEELKDLLARHPASDFYLSREWKSPAHDPWSPADGEKYFLLSREVIQRP